MRLKKLIVHGFKSFADQVEIVFEDGITGVVGPNGCGKSNIADAVRWVLGEQSAKSLRGAKMEDVIFNGTEKRRRLAFCEVTVIFDNTDHSLAFDFAEVQVTRRAYRDGEGEYRINGNLCRLRDVVELFRDTGIGKEGYSIIGQGRIDEILSVKSEDRRQVFEEAAGIVKFKTRKTDAERKLENTTDNLNRVEDILGELQERVEPLRQQSETAKEFLTLREELKDLELNSFLTRTDRYNVRMKEIADTLAELDAAIADTQARHEETGKQQYRFRVRLDELENETAGKRERVQELIQETEGCEGTLSVFRERIAAGEKEKKRLTEQRDAAGNGAVGIQEHINTLNAALEKAKAVLDEMSGKLRSDETELGGQEATLRQLEAENEEKKQRIIEAMNRLSDVRSQHARLTAMLAALEKQLAGMEEDKKREAVRRNSLEEQIREAREHLDAEKKRRDEIRRLREESEEQVKALNEKVVSLTAEAAQNEKRRQAADSRLKLLREMQRDYDGYQNSVKQVLIHSKKTNDPGIHGVVADLIQVPEKYERAVDMVMGATLQNIVVDRDEDAKRMIEYLRANHYGRATFLPIGSVRGRTLTPQERMALELPGCFGVASELIGFDEQYKGVVDYLLGRTLIAKNLQSGIEIQRATRYTLRLVTLEGDVMNAGGSMTGGSVQSRATSLLSRTREIEECERELREVDQELAEIGHIREAMEEERTRQKQERNDLYNQEHEQDVLCARAEELLKAVQEEQRNDEQRTIHATDEWDRLNFELEEVRSSLSRLVTEQDDREKNQGVCQSEVRELSARISDLRETVDALRRRVSDERVKFAEHKRGYEADLANSARLSRQITDSEKILRESNEQLIVCESELSKNRSDMEENTQALESVKKRLNEARDDFNRCDRERTQVQKSLQQTAEQMEQIRTEAEALGGRKHKAELSQQRTENEYQAFQKRIWDDYEMTYAGAEEFRKPDFNLSEADRRITQIRQRIKTMGSVNVSAVEEYRQTVERMDEMSTERDDLVKARVDLEQIIAELEKKMEDQFHTEFEKINRNFTKTFTALFSGGRAELKLSDPKDALNCGIDVEAQPPGKKLQSLMLMSGGERALTAIAILFAILDLKPTPFCILDEIEAALDDANIDTYADYLKNYSHNTQFIVITHRKGTMEHCDALYGVVMQEKGVSKTVSVKLNEALQGV